MAEKQGVRRGLRIARVLAPQSNSAGVSRRRWNAKMDERGWPTGPYCLCESGEVGIPGVAGEKQEQKRGSIGSRAFWLIRPQREKPRQRERETDQIPLLKTDGDVKGFGEGPSIEKKNRGKGILAMGTLNQGTGTREVGRGGGQNRPSRGRCRSKNRRASPKI